MSNREGNSVFEGGTPRPGAAGMPTRNVMKDDFGLEIPAEQIPIPSGGRVYSSDSPLYNRETVEIRPMTAREEDILTSKALIKKGTVITELIRSCLIDKSIDPDDMIVGDRNAVMTALRITGYGADYTVDVECPACGERSRQEFDLSELPLKRLGTDPSSEGENTFEFTLPYTKKAVKFRFLTGRDETQISKMQDRKKKHSFTKDNLITTRYKHQIISIAGITDKVKIEFFIKNMPAKDSRALRKFMDDNEPGVEMKSWMDCPSCMETSEVRLPLGASFFWPDSNS